MEADLIKVLSQYGPWGLAGAMAILLRKELIVLFRAPKDDRAVEQALLRMGNQFEANLEQFKKANHTMDQVLEELREGNTRQERLLLEFVRKRQ